MTDAEKLEQTAAHLRIAADALDDLVVMILRIGGYLSPEDSRVFADACKALDIVGRRRVEKPKTWIDRVCSCARHPEGGRVLDPKCPIESHREEVARRIPKAR